MSLRLHDTKHGTLRLTHGQSFRGDNVSEVTTSSGEDIARLLGSCLACTAKGARAETGGRDLLRNARSEEWAKAHQTEGGFGSSCRSHSLEGCAWVRARCGRAQVPAHGTFFSSVRVASKPVGFLAGAVSRPQSICTPLPVWRMGSSPSAATTRAASGSADAVDVGAHAPDEAGTVAGSTQSQTSADGVPDEKRQSSLHSAVGLVFDRRMCAHDAGSSAHPECPARITSIFEAFEKEGLAERCVDNVDSTAYGSERLTSGRTPQVSQCTVQRHN